MLLLAMAVGAGTIPAAVLIGPVNAGQQQGLRTISLFARDEGSSFSFIDNRPLQGGPEEPITAGDGFVGSQKLFTRAGKRAGTFDFACTAATGGSRSRLLCTGVYGLAAGTIMAQASFASFERPIRIAIVGGTGAYEGARGSVISRERKDGTLDTIRLLP